MNANPVCHYIEFVTARLLVSLGNGKVASIQLLENRHNQKSETVASKAMSCECLAQCSYSSQLIMCKLS